MTTNKKSTLIIILLFILSITSFTISKDLNNKEIKNINNETIAITLDEYAPENKKIKMLADKDNTEPVASNFCKDVQPTLRIMYYVIIVLKIMVPLGIIFMGSFDFYNAVTGGNADNLKKEAIILGKRCLTGLIIFFAPTLINLVINAADPSPSDYKKCTDCIFKGTCDNTSFNTNMQTKTTTQKHNSSSGKF